MIYFFKTLRFHDDNGDDEKGVRKDKHLARLFYTGDFRHSLIKQLTEDVNLLKRHNLMDYSLLVGVHHVEDSEEPEPAPGHPSQMGMVIILFNFLRFIYF